jgi:hypothetical protein
MPETDDSEANKEQLATFGRSDAELPASPDGTPVKDSLYPLDNGMGKIPYSDRHDRTIDIHA